MATQPMVPVKEERKERLRNLTDEFGCTYDELVKTMLEQVEPENLNPERFEARRNVGRLSAGNRTSAVMGRLEDRPLNESVVSTARELVESAYEEGIVNRRQVKTVAAAAEYSARIMESGESSHNRDFNQEDVAEVHDVSVVSIRETYHDLINNHYEGLSVPA